MNKRRMNDVDNYLSLKQIVLLSLAITIGYYSLFALSHYFGRPTFAGSNNQEEVDLEKEHIVGSNEYTFGEIQKKWPALFNADRFQPGYKFIRPRFSVILLFNVPFTFLMIFAVFLYNRKIMSKTFKRHSDELLTNIIGSLLIAGVLSSICTLVQLYIWPYGPGPQRSLIGYISRGMLGDFTLVAIAFIFSYLQRSLYQEREIAVENEKLRAENLTSRYEALKTQMDPHFLFNSLNTLKSLIDIDIEKAEDFVQQLSSVLRYTLQNKEVVTLADELTCVEAYCDMMHIRYGENLRFEIDIDPKYYKYNVLPLSVQGLIENAIKHNVVSGRQPLTVRLSTGDDGMLTVSNVKHPKVTDEEGSGIGLANLTERYRIKWNENVEIFDDGTNFRVTLPLKQEE